MSDSALITLAVAQILLQCHSERRFLHRDRRSWQLTRPATTSEVAPVRTPNDN